MKKLKEEEKKEDLRQLKVRDENYKKINIKNRTFTYTAFVSSVSTLCLCPQPLPTNKRKHCYLS